MKIRHVLVAAAVLFLLVPQATFAVNGQDCVAQGGTCGLAGLQSEDVGTLDCPAPRHCYVRPPSTERPPEETPAQSTNSGSSGSETSQVQSPSRLVLPACTKTGNCTLDDIVRTGVNFATFIMGLSGALFFAVFIYGGAMYLISFGDMGRVKKGKEAIKGAVIGLIFVLGAWTIVNTLTKGLTGTSDNVAGVPQACAAQGTGFSCVTLQGNTSQEAVASGQSQGLTCRTGLCPGPANVLCCRQN